ncbi:hypothetical protein Tco_0497629, partial [Tanacetum coccineum]
YGFIKNHKKTVKNGQARTQESEEYKKKPKNQNRSQKSQPAVKSSQHWSTEVVSPPIVSTSNAPTPTDEKSNDGFQTVGKKKKRKGKSKSSNGCQFASPSVQQTIRYEPKETPSAPKKRATNVRNPSKFSSM